MVQSLKYEDLWYTCNMKSGACTCPKGINCAPCHHKSAVAKDFNTAEFSVVPAHDPCQQAMYHYIATGTTLKAHMYRRRDDDQSIPEIEKFISEKLLKEMPEVNEVFFFNVNEVEIIDDDVEMDAKPEVNGEVDDDENEVGVNDDEEDEARNVKDLFLKSLTEYGEKVAAMNDRNSIIAMKAMTKKH